VIKESIHSWTLSQSNILSVQYRKKARKVQSIELLFFAVINIKFLSFDSGTVEGVMDYLEKSKNHCKSNLYHLH
jgi:hypothetical protein